MSAISVSAQRLVTLLAEHPLQRPAYRSLAAGIRGLLIDGRLAHQTRLPSERELSTALRVSRTTVTRAYDELVTNGWATVRRGSGTTLLVPGRQTTAGQPLLPSESDDGSIDLTNAAPGAPPGTMAAIEHALQLLPARLSGPGYRITGEAVLRERIADRYAARGLATDPDQIIVTPGALAAVVLLARAVLGAGDRAVLETPTYPNSVGALRGAGARVVGFPVDDGGWDVTGLEAMLRQTSPRLALLLPDFQNPTGALMDDPTRERVAAALARTRTIGIADETMVELPLDIDEDDMPPPLAAYHPEIVSVGSTSKAFWGGVRIGWLRVPLSLRDRVVRARTTLDLGCSIADQLIGYELLGERERLLGERRTALRDSRTALTAALREQLPQWRFTVPSGGVTLWVRMPDPVTNPLVAVAQRHGIRLASGAQFGVDQPLRHYLRLPFTVPADQIPEAVDRLAAAYAEVRESADSAPSERAPFVA